jgi:RPA family protein
MISRQTARKVRVWDLMNGSFIKKEGFEPSVIRIASGEEVSRARIMGTIVAKFVAEDGNYAAVTLDDGSDTIRLKTFKTTKPLDTLNVGDVVDAIGKIREYEGEKYIIPEVARKIDDPNLEILRRLELVYKERGLQKTKELLEKNKGKDPEELRKELIEKHGLEKQWVDMFLAGKKEKEKGTLKKQLLDIIGASKDGMVYSELIKKVKAKGADIESAVDELLNDGLCYEPSPGRIRKI